MSNLRDLNYVYVRIGYNETSANTCIQANWLFRQPEIGRLRMYSANIGYQIGYTLEYFLKWVYAY